MRARAFKRCPRCGRVKSAAEFYRRRRTLRLSPYCQPCTRAAARESRNRRRQDPASAELLRAVDRDRQRRRRALGGQGGPAGRARIRETNLRLRRHTRRSQYEFVS